MMSKMQWFVLLCMYVVYLLLGATVFYEVENREEAKRKLASKEERQDIEELLIKHYVPNEEHNQKEIFEKLTTYCGKPIHEQMSEVETPMLWDFYHSLFFVITVVSTIGYGNLSPTTTFTRIFMIFYGTIGISINGIVIMTLGDFFGKSFLKLYDRWKTLKMQHALATLGLVGQIILYLIPGFTFFIILPSIIIMFYEGWKYDVAVSYAFVTLTTIGFGDYVAGTKENGHGSIVYTLYQLFLLVWIISGLGYLLMVLGFVTRGMRSEKMHAIEHKIAHNIKKTNNKIREELRYILNEYLLMRVKRVYRERRVFVPPKILRSQSCPDLTMYSYIETPPMARKRTVSAFTNLHTDDLPRIQSDSDLHRIDKEKTFKTSTAIVEPSQLLMRVVNALGHYDPLSSPSTSSSSGSFQDPDLRLEGIDMFSSTDILANERNGSGWSLSTQRPHMPRPRAASECKQPRVENFEITSNDMTWYGPPATKRLQELREKALYNRSNKTASSISPSTPTLGFLKRLKNTFKNTKDDGRNRNVDVERQDSNPSLAYDYNNTSQQPPTLSALRNKQVLEETSIADFIRALTAISIPDVSTYQGKRKLGTGTMMQPENVSSQRTQRIPGVPSRHPSLVPSRSPLASFNRRFSVSTQNPNYGAYPPPPPPYHPYDTIHSGQIPNEIVVRPNNRRFSLRPVTGNSSSNPVQSQVQRHVFRVKKIPESKNSDSNHKGDP